MVNRIHTTKVCSSDIISQLHSGLIWKRPVDQLRATSLAINPNCHNNDNDFLQTGTDRTPIAVRVQQRSCEANKIR